MDERGQTTQDFAIGVSVLLVTIIGAFVFTQGGALSVYEGTSPGVQQPQADRIASYIVQNYSDDDQRNTLDYTSIDGNLSGDLSDLKQRAGVNVASDRRTNPIVNVSIVDGETLRDGQLTPTDDPGIRLAWGQYRRSESASASRVVQLEGGGCDPVCWLVVRVW